MRQHSNMADVVKGVLMHEMDTNVLFEKFTIAEIQGIEKKTRSDIEKKKEDLRLMVGERYRDLIEAADTITEMKNSAENVMQSISQMQSYCKNLKQTHMVKGVSVQRRSKTAVQKTSEGSQFYGIAAQIKLLLDMPEKIWSSIEDKNYLLATQLFLLSRHINTSLQMESQQSAKILTWFPVLSRQWAAISHFKGTILRGCRNMLKDTAVKAQAVADCLCSLLLLEDSTPRQVFNEFLLARTTAVQQLFHPDQSHSSIKEQVCEVVQLIATTIHQIHAVFYQINKKQQEQSPVECNLLMKTLTKVTSKDDPGSCIIDMQSSVAMKHLPKAVIEFRPSLRTVANPVSSQHLQENCLQWASTCMKDVSAGVSKLLGFVGSIKGLSTIRDAVWDQLHQDEKMKTWDDVCQHVIQGKLSIWEEFIRPLFLNRTKAILQGQFDNTLSTTKQNMAKVMSELSNMEDRALQGERDSAAFIWTESSNDIPSHTAWTPSAQKTLADGGGLIMKAKAYTPVVQNLCRSFDSKLKLLLEDVRFYLSVSEKSTATAEERGTSPSSDTDGGPFDKFADNKAIEGFLQSTCQDCIHKLLSHIKQQLYGAKQQLGNCTQHADSIIMLDRVLLLGRTCAALCELSQHLQQCMLGGKKPEVGGGRHLRKSSMKLGVKGQEQPQWTALKAMVMESSQEAYSIWGDSTAGHLVGQFEVNMLADGGQNLLRSSTRWDEVVIQEETEDGRTITSNIRVPMQASWYVQDLLYQMCKEINRIGGHALPRSVLVGASYQTTDGILAAYEKLISKNKDASSKPLISQNRSLQLLFDLRFIMAVIARKEDTPENKAYNKSSTRVVDSLEALVDPFDLDVFSPYMMSHLSRQSQRSSVLFGALTSLDRQGLYSSARPAQAGHQEQHNVLPLSSSQNRFGLLPLSTQPRPVVPQPILQPPKPKALEASVSVDPLPHAATASSLATMKPSSSFYNKLESMSTIWFSNIGGKS